MEVAVPLSILADTPSGPVDLEISSDATRSNTSSSVQRKPEGKFAGSRRSRISMVFKVTCVLYLYTYACNNSII